MIVGRIVSGRYVRVEEDGKPRGGADYFHGVKPSDLVQLDGRQLYLAAERLHETVNGGVGSKAEHAQASEALHQCYAERARRRSTIR
jgi:hypothetical protein